MLIIDNKLRKSKTIISKPISGNQLKNIQYRTMFTISNTILCKPTILNTIIRTMKSPTDKVVKEVIKKGEQNLPKPISHNSTPKSPTGTLSESVKGKAPTVTPPSSQPQTKAVDSSIVKSAKEHEKAANQSSVHEKIDQARPDLQPNSTPPLSDVTKDSNKNQFTNLGRRPEENAMAKALGPHLQKYNTVGNEFMEIPTPPTPPPLPDFKPLQSSSTSSTSFTEQIKSLSSEDDNSNIKPSVVKTKFEYKIPATTTITKDTTSSDLSDNEALFELKMRGLLKDDKDKNIVSFKTESGEDVTIGGNIFKFSQLGQAYVEQQNKPKIIIPNTSDSLSAEGENRFEFKLATISHKEETFFPSAKEKHLVVIYDKNTSQCHIIGWLTSKKTETKISDKQFKVYQDEKLGIQNNSDKSKDQRFKRLDNAEEIPKEKLTFIALGEDYINDVQQKQPDIFKNLYKELSQKALTIFNPNEFNKDDAIKLCQAFDKNVTEKKAQPKSKDQIKLDDQNQLKQKEINEEKKLKASMSKQESTTQEETNENKT
jgi:hypothetical protein